MRVSAHSVSLFLVGFIVANHNMLSWIINLLLDALLCISLFSIITQVIIEILALSMAENGFIFRFIK